MELFQINEDNDIYFSFQISSQKNFKWTINNSLDAVSLFIMNHKMTGGHVAKTCFFVGGKQSPK